MASLAEQMTSAEAARQLSVGARQVERLVESGELTRVASVGRAWLIDAASVQRLRERGTGKGRPWAVETIRAAIEILDMGRTDRLEGAQRSRLRARLRQMTAQEFVRATRRRADIARYRASTSFLAELRAQVALTGAAAVDADRATAGQLGLAAARRDLVDGYVGREAAAELTERFFLVEDVRGNVTLRIVDHSFEAEGAVADLVTVALDLADSLDIRERSAALRVLDERLAALR